MEGFVIRVTAYHGDPKPIGKVYARSGISHDTVVPLEDVINDPNNDVILDRSCASQTSDYDIDALIADFQDEYGCKVSYPEVEARGEGLQVFEYDIFEPSWPDQEEAEDVIDDLTRRLVDWVSGYPAGR